MRFARGIVLVGLAACARATPPSGARSEHGPAAASPSISSAAPPSEQPALAAADASVRATAPGAAEPTTGMDGDRSIETACNGVDDDGDGLTDVLLPVGPNACRTEAKGACGAGFAACEGGKRVCLAPPPVPEVLDGVDNDCNGVVDDVPPTKVRPRALVLVPRYAWTDAAPDIANVTSALAQAGIPYDQQVSGTDWSSALGMLDDYALAIVPGYLLGSAMGAAREKLEAFARNGGVVVVFKPVGTAEQPAAWKLTGLSGGVRHRGVLELRFDGTASAATAAIDSPEERTLVLNAKADKNGVEVWTLEPDPAEHTVVVATAHAESGPVGGAITRRPLGKGAVYAIGHDLASFAQPRCYVNCFEPSGDVLRLVLEGALREGAAGHVVLVHTVPAEARSALLVTHDIDAPDSQNVGDWGDPGAIQVAEVERARGVRATFNITTDYVAGYWNPNTIRQLCALGMCPLGAHSVVHSGDFGRMPEGTCAEAQGPSYGASPTLCGEIRVSMQMIRAVTRRSPRVWRSPYLALHPRQFDVLATSGIAFDSSFGVGDLPFNLPLDLATTGVHQNRFHHQPMLEFPVACEDGRDVVEGGKHQRLELQASNEASFRATWEYVLLRNVQNRAFTTLLMHPSRGRNLPAENVRVKVAALDGFLARALRADVVARPLEEIGDFWRARLDTHIDARFDEATGYQGTIATGKSTAPGFTLEFGDAVTSFDCASCGEVHIKGKRVVITKPLRPRAKVDFTAKIR